MDCDILAVIIVMFSLRGRSTGRPLCFSKPDFTCYGGHMAEKRILVTGVSGFIGSNLAARLLKEGYEVVGIDNLSQGSEKQIPGGVEFHDVDIRTAEMTDLFTGIDVVFHLAAKNSLSDCQKDPVGTMEINVTGTARVFDAALKAGVRKVAYAQSSVLEEGEARQTGFYAISKAAGILLARGYEALGLTTVGLRYFNVYGPGQDYRRSAPPVMSDLIIQLLTRGSVSIVEGSSENKRDFIHVDDINDFHVLCITDDRVNNQMFRLGSGKNYSIAEVLMLIQTLLGTNVTPVVRPREGADPAVQTLADIRDAQSLGWEPKVALEDGLRSMITYIQGEIATGKIK